MIGIPGVRRIPRWAGWSAAACGFLLGAVAALAGEPFVPSWIENDAAGRSVRIDLVAGWNGNNIHRWNLNGYYKGNLTIRVPAGWSVTIDFRNDEERFEHSLLLVRPYEQLQMPLKLNAADAVDGVHTARPTEGMATGASERLTFTARAGSYFLASGALIQMVEGLYIRFDVEDGLDGASAVFNRRVPALDDEPFRP
jgi:hypothetical protein